MENEIKVGDKIPTGHRGYLKIMAYADNYYMVRYKGSVPFVCDLKKLKYIIAINKLDGKAINKSTL